MDPRVAWCAPEQLGPSHELWTRLWEISHSSNNMNAQNRLNLNNNNASQEYIPLELDNQKSEKVSPNKASTYGLNHSSSLHRLRENGGLTPWREPGKHYSSGPIGFVASYFNIIQHILLSLIRFYVV